MLNLSKLAPSRSGGGDAVYTETTYSYFKFCDTAIKWCGQVGKDHNNSFDPCSRKPYYTFNL